MKLEKKNQKVRTTMYHLEEHLSMLKLLTKRKEASIIIKSKLYLARPVVFKIRNHHLMFFTDKDNKYGTKIVTVGYGDVKEYK